jgi:acyl-ACP thioesterase
MDNMAEIKKFADYLIEWIVCKSDVEFDRATEFEIVRVIIDCVDLYRKGE